MGDPVKPQFRFSGHETFACRYAWLPKAYRLLVADSSAFSDEDKAIAALGIGKNMVRSLRFWLEAFDLVEPGAGRDLRLNKAADLIFGVNGRDPFLEDERTIWLLHWRVSSRSSAGLFAWHYLLYEWRLPEFTKSEALRAFQKESLRLGHSHSEVTLAQHLDVFLHTYLSNRNEGTAIEDSLDSPFVGLQLLEEMGARPGVSGRRETVYSFRKDPSPGISASLFEYSLWDYWHRFRGSERTLTARDVTYAPCSPGRTFRLSEDDVRDRLEGLAASQVGSLKFTSSTVQTMIATKAGPPPPNLEIVYD